MLCTDERRQFLWCLLNAEDAIPRHDAPIRITGANKPKSVVIKAPSSKLPEQAVDTSNNDRALTVARSAKHPAGSAKRIDARTNASTIEQALALRDALRTVGRQAGELARALKQQKRQARIVATTLASLNELQKVAG